MVNIAGNSHETDQNLSWAFVNILEYYDVAFNIRAGVLYQI